jgi:hypothetical protein
MMDLLNAGAMPDRNGLTRAGRAYQKHSNRAGSVFKKITNQSPAGYNAAGQQALKNILHDTRLIVLKNKYGGVDFFSQGGAGPGVRFGPPPTPDLMGFLEPI